MRAGRGQDRTKRRGTAAVTDAVPRSLILDSHARSAGCLRDHLDIDTFVHPKGNAVDGPTGDGDARGIHLRKRDRLFGRVGRHPDELVATQRDLCGNTVGVTLVGLEIVDLPIRYIGIDPGGRRRTAGGVDDGAFVDFESGLEGLLNTCRDVTQKPGPGA